MHYISIYCDYYYCTVLCVVRNPSFELLPTSFHLEKQKCELHIKECNDIVVKERAYCNVIRDTIKKNEKECTQRLEMLSRSQIA